MPLHDTSYRHWDGVHLGVWRRRLVIAQNALGLCAQHKLMRSLVVMCWMAGLGAAGVLFMTGQLLVPDSLMVTWLSTLNPQLRALGDTLTSWLGQHPEISVRATQDVLFYFFSIYLLLPVSIFALGMALPSLITRDLASNAIIIYSSKAINRGDYLLGKAAAVMGLLSLTWLGPVCGAWFFGNLLAPDWRFFWHARVALIHILTFGPAAMALLALLALGVSAISSHERATVGLWFMWWIVGGMLAPIAIHTQPWLRHLSFNYNLEQLALAIFAPGEEIHVAQENIPILGNLLGGISPRTMEALNSPTVAGSAFTLIIMLACAAFILHRRVKPE